MTTIQSMRKSKVQQEEELLLPLEDALRLNEHLARAVRDAIANPKSEVKVHLGLDEDRQTRLFIVVSTNFKAPS